MKTDGDVARVTDLLLGKLDPSEAAKALDEVANDAEMSRWLEIAIDLRAFALKEGEEVFAEQKSMKRGMTVEARGVFHDLDCALWRSRLAWITACICFSISGYIIGIALSSAWDPLDDPEAQWISWGARRLPMESDLTRAEFLFQRGEYENALRVLDRHLKTYPKDPLNGQVMYNAVVLDLFLSRRTMLGIRYGSDTLRVLENVYVLEQIEGGQYTASLRDRAIILNARALVSIGRNDQAVQKLREIVTKEGVYRGEAEELVERYGLHP